MKLYTTDLRWSRRKHFKDFYRDLNYTVVSSFQMKYSLESPAIQAIQ